MFCTLNTQMLRMVENELRGIFNYAAEMGHDGPDAVPVKAATHLLRAQGERDPVGWLMRAVECRTLRRVALDPKSPGVGRAAMLCTTECRLASKSFFVDNWGPSGEKLSKLAICMVLISAHCGIWIEVAEHPEVKNLDASQDSPTRRLR